MALAFVLLDTSPPATARTSSGGLPAVDSLIGLDAAHRAAPCPTNAVTTAITVSIFVLALVALSAVDRLRRDRARDRNAQGWCARCGRPLGLDARSIPVAGAVYRATFANVCPRCFSRNRIAWTFAWVVLALAFLAAILSAWS